MTFWMSVLFHVTQLQLRLTGSERMTDVSTTVCSYLKQDAQAWNLGEHDALALLLSNLKVGPDMRPLCIELEGLYRGLPATTQLKKK
jgi:hypothetical protein